MEDINTTKESERKRVDTKETPTKDTPNLYNYKLKIPEKQAASKNMVDRSRLRIKKAEEKVARLKAILKNTPTSPLASIRVEGDPPTPLIDTKPFINLEKPLLPILKKDDAYKATEIRSGKNASKIIQTEVSPIFHHMSVT